MGSKVTIVSCGLSVDSLTAQIKTIVGDASIVYGGRRLLELFPEYVGETMSIGANFRECVEAIVEHVRKDQGDVVVLGSGDSLLYGIANSFVDRLTEEQLVVIPNITAAQGLFSAAGIPWDRVTFFSIHGRTCRLPWIQILNATLPVIYCDYRRTPADVLQELLSRFPDCVDREVVVGEDLGAETELISRGTVAGLSETDFSPLSVMALLPADTDEVCDPGLILGLDDSAYAQYNAMITHSEVRAVVISKLRLGAGVMWDLGAGSGSISIEAASLCRDLEVYAVEYHDDRVAVVNENIEMFAAGNVNLVHGRILDEIDSLPQPRSIFVGGGGKEVAEIVTRSYAALRPGGVLVASAVLLETQVALAGVLEEACHEVVTLTISRSKKLGDSRMMKGSNPITLFVYKKDLI